MAHSCSCCGAPLSERAVGPCPACLIALASLPASRVPDFHVETLLGSGPAGTTYLARTAAGRLLAIKKIPGEFPVDGAAEDLESRLSARCHESVVPLQALQPEAEGLTMIRDFVQGRPFSAWIPSAGAAERSRAFERLSEAIDVLHARGLAHGHIVPTNVVIVDGHEPMLLDAGARLLADAVRRRTSNLDAMRREDRLSLDELRQASLP